MFGSTALHCAAVAGCVFSLATLAQVKLIAPRQGTASGGGPSGLAPADDSAALSGMSQAPWAAEAVLPPGSSAARVFNILNGATQTATPIAPGMIVTITGTDLGPSSGVVAEPTPAGTYTSKLSDTRVLFDGVPAPLLYVSGKQINAIVPYLLQGRVSARVEVEVGAGLSLPVRAEVADAAPGIFAAAANGRGAAAAVNSDSSVNSGTQPAARGSIIAIYATGEGQTDPPGQDGRVILTDVRRPRLPVTVRIAGQPAEVLYAGSAPALVSGVFQVNVRIPSEIDSGAVPVEIQVGDAVSQPGIAIYVR